MAVIVTTISCDPEQNLSFIKTLSRSWFKNHGFILNYFKMDLVTQCLPVKLRNCDIFKASVFKKKINVTSES